MKILIASDSYKGSLTSLEVAKIIQEGFNTILDNPTYDVISMADGGEGTIAALTTKTIKLKALNSDGTIIDTYYGHIDQDRAIIEMATINGITLVDNKNIQSYNTYGTGQLIVDALNKGYKEIYLAIGGSATNDGGIGMASALGIKFLDINNNELPPIPINLKKIKSIDYSRLNSKIKNTKIIVMCDVNNPLLGKNGASYVYAKQKGASDKDIKELDEGLSHLAKVINNNQELTPGAGAAGGLGYGLLSFVGASLKPGIETVMDITDFDNHVKDCDLVITGEGRLDIQSLNGKVPIGVSKEASKYGIKTIAIVGCLGDDTESLDDYFLEIQPCTTKKLTKQEIKDQAKENLSNASIIVANKIKKLFK
ncbi:MAG: glycerate kinase [Thomasclavelia sp.]|nr:glycerate kinase [Thomasclavelia sp.]